MVTCCILILGRRQLVKLRAAIAASRVNSIDAEAMKMRVGIESVSVALHKRDSAALRSKVIAAYDWDVFIAFINC